ncbi:MAG: putative ribosome quality control (RQC) complex YloA/Tae2 family protein [Arcobacteraceae bacterium]|jgi:predicted ribosome quality control (RQC) complex YloA/Tae2 family protein
MKHYILKELVEHLNNYKNIKYIKRIDNNTIKIEFNNQNIYYFDLPKGDGNVYKKENNENIKKDFNAPFDVLLHKRFTSSNIQNIKLLNDDKIIHIEVQSKSSYKTETTILQMEFTGKNTNIIILDENNIILEALRHIDEWSSIRMVKVGIKLEPLEKPDFAFEEKRIEDIDSYLLDIYKNKELKELENIKKQKFTQLNKHIKKIQKILNGLENIDLLKINALKYNNEASDILADLYDFEGYKKNVKLKESKDLFTKSKKTKQKIKNQHIEETNLTQKLEFYNRLTTIIKNLNTKDEIEFYIPKKDKNQKKTKKENPYKSFFIDGYKIMLGRDERENIYLLENSRASDFWFHLQDQVSSHVIISNTKKTVPEKLISEAAKICAKFSSDFGGTFNVDYTQRRNVKIQTRANVLYNPYSTIVVKV